MTVPKAKPASSVTIVEAEAHHAEAMSAFMQGLVAERLETVFERDAAPTEEEELEFIRKTAENDRAAIFLALSGETVVGLLDFRAHAKPQMAHGGEFGVSVAKDYCGQGVARRLLEQLLIWAEARGFKRVDLRVFSNNTNALRLYERLGFVKEGCQKEAVRVGNSFVDLLYMTRFL